MALPTGPTISCDILNSPVAVIASYAGLPVEGATVTLFFSTLASMEGFQKITATTNAVGLAQACFPTGYFVQARIQKTGINFGSGIGVQHIIGVKSGLDRLWNPTFLIIALPCKLPQVYNPATSKCEPPPALPCGGIISITEPNWTSLLSGPTLPGSIAVPFTITAASGAEIPDKIPIDIFIDYTKAFYYEGKPGNNSIDILAIIRTVLGAAALNTAHTMTMVVNAPDCNIPAPPPLNIPPLIPAAPAFGIISIPSVPKPPKIPYPVKISIDGILAGEPPISKEVPAGIHNITAELKGMTNIYRKVSVESGKTLTITDIAFEEILVPCTVWDTTANISIPSILQLPFNIDISNANWICKATGEKTPVNATAELLVGAQKFYIPIYSGAGSFSLTQTDIDNIIAGIITTPTTPTTPTAGERVGDYCEIAPMPTTFAMAFFNVVHDTLGKIYSGNTYDQAKYKAQQDSRCFKTPAVAPCVTITITHRKWSDPKNAVIGFYSTPVGSRYGQGEQAWGWGGMPKLTDNEYLQTVAIPKTLDYLGGKFKSLYGRDMKKSDICGQ